MLNWLVEDPSIVLMVLGALAAVLAVLWWRLRKGRYGLGLTAVLLLIGIVWLLGMFVDTDNKRIERKVRDMAAALKEHNARRLFENVSDSFKFNGLSKAEFRQRAEGVITRGDVTDVEVWNFERGEVSRENRTGKVSFYVKPKGNWSRELYYLCRAEFVLDPDGQWRLKGFQLFEPFVNTNTPIQIPGF